ncbi:hypothetical protein SISSUDRAFT_1049661 [Sistotremastrum suecicum HHB10207 ss-3]|uniref:F-box domain-containing protein n=1 Tax=Sistotremastrum suecicum HHB10207 ss-3 TaxID=1314776 RepID=A0A166BQ10_9AGAM|nr:hypothetical protein SISSUDRAFT_1049661 [Sistotremastrum suecicum HHB10207 ss-3]
MRADNLNYDVLVIIFSYFTKIRDLANVCLVSKTWNGVAEAFLYRTVNFVPPGLGGGQYSKRTSVLKTFGRRPRLVKHIHHFNILSSSYEDSTLRGCLSELLWIIDRADNLASFSYSPHLADPLPSQLILSLKAKTYLRDLDIPGTSDEKTVQVLQTLGWGEQNLRSLSLSGPTWTTLHHLPDWTSNLTQSLRSFTVKEPITGTTVMPSRDAGLMDSVLLHLPNLTNLVLRYSSIPYWHQLSLLSRVPLLEHLTLALSQHCISVSEAPLASVPQLPGLQHLTLEVRDTIVLRSVFQLSVFKVPLHSLTLKLHSALRIDEDLISTVMNAYSATLQRFNLDKGVVSDSATREILSRGKALVQIAFNLDIKNLENSAKALSLSDTLRTLIDTSPSVMTNVQRHLRADDVRVIFDSCPSLSTITSGKRTWRREAFYNGTRFTSS